jgi:hypothetical protein
MSYGPNFPDLMRRAASLERDLYSDDVPSLDRRITSSLTAVT